MGGRFDQGEDPKNDIFDDLFLVNFRFNRIKYLMYFYFLEGLDTLYNDIICKYYIEMLI